ncbi:putative ABC transporter [Aureobasidium sp. EXF-8845]|nr:putative ABC transporter [Aureobasidium sp. EXF-8845]KAI4854569.1 putative ABC transporter [Aureobasidium sp. EXF-8846]
MFFEPPRVDIPLICFLQLILSVLLALKAIFLAFRTRQTKLRTSFLTPAGALDIIATFVTVVLTHLEDERSKAPSTVLVLYYSASSLCFLPILRTTWLLEDNVVCSLTWTFIWLLTLVVLVLESSTKRSWTAQKSRDVMEEQLASFWGRSFFIYLLPFLWFGYSNTIGISDIPAVDKPLRSKAANEQLLPYFRRYKGRFRLLRAILSAFIWSLASAIVPRLSLTGFSFCQAFLISATLRLMKDQEENIIPSYKGGIIGAYVLVYFGLAASRSIYRRQAYRFVTTARACLVNLVYDHALGADDGLDSDRRAITAMGTNVEQAINGLGDIHEIWACIIEMALAIWLLTKQVAAASAVPVIICIISLVTCGFLSKALGPAIAAWNGKVQIRLSVTSRMLGVIKAVKLQGLGDILYKHITALRTEELKTSELFRRLIVAKPRAANIPVDFAPFATFTIYAISSNRTGSISIEQAFTALALITLLTAPLLNFCQAFPSLVQAIACLGRIEEYCSSTSNSGNDTEIDKNVPTTSVIELGVFGHGCRGVTQPAGSTSLNPSVILCSPNLCIEKGITAIIGSTGSGKSTLLREILRGQAYPNDPESCDQLRVAYCKQDPWIMSRTIRENIVGNLEFDKDWFDTTLSLCELKTDLAALKTGDLHCAGDKGMNISGGQRQRIALARAVYSRIKVVVLDDPFSGIDPQITSTIIENLLGVDGWFRRTNTSVVVATHDSSFAAYADKVVSISDGVVLSQYSNSPMPDQRLDENSDSSVSPGNVYPCPPLAPKVAAAISAATLTSPQEFVVSTNRAPVPKRSWSPYKYYFAAISWPWLSLLLAATLVEALASNLSAFWLEHWADQDGPRTSDGLGLFIGVYALICLLSFLGIAVGCWSSARLHSDLLKVTIR